MAFNTTPRKPMMYFWSHDLGLTGTSNQRDNDHDVNRQKFMLKK